jgi:membrane dipeptidase
MNALNLNRNLDLEIPDLRAHEKEQGMPEPGRGHNTTTFPEMRRGEVFLSVVTVIARATRPGSNPKDAATQEISYGRAQGQLGYYRVLEAQNKVRMISDANALAEHTAAWRQNPDAAPLGFILSMEGADPIAWPEQVHAWYEDGLRVVSLSHYGISAYAHGTGTEGGLTAEGPRLLVEMEKAGIILDLTHLADQAFWEALDNFSGPVLASHNNCRALVSHQRQFTDEQLKAIIERDGVVGAALDAWMLYPDWIKGETSPEVLTLDAVADHIDHVCQLAGNTRHAGIGSDLDGGYGTEQTPGDLDTIADLQKLDELLRRKGYSTEDIEGIFHGNWLRFFREVWS